MFGVWHFSFTVSDLDEAVDFYTRLLRFELIHIQQQDNEYTRTVVGYPDANIRVAQLAVPGQWRGISTHDLELVHYLQPSGTRGDHNIYNPGQGHLALAVDDIDAEYHRLSEAGVQFFSPPQRITAGVNEGGACVYLYGVDHLVHELVEPPAHRRAALVAASGATGAANEVSPAAAEADRWKAAR